MDRRPIYAQPVQLGQIEPTKPAPDIGGRLAALEALLASQGEHIAGLNFGKANASTVGGLSTAMNHLQSDVAAISDAMPAPATVAPMPEKTGASLGTVDRRYALEDHQHPRLTSTTYATLDPNGRATVAFTRTFTNKPGLNLTETDASASQPLVLRAIAWSQNDAGLYTGVTIQGSRAQALPTLNPLSGVLTLLSQVLSGVNTVVAALTNYNVFGGSAAAAVVSVIAIARSDIAAT